MVILFLYWITINVLYKADYEFVADEADTIQYILNSKTPDLSLLKQVVVDAPLHTDSIYQYYIRVVDKKKQVIIETPGMDAILPKKNYSRRLLKRNHYWITKNATNYLILYAPLTTLNKQENGYLQIILDVSHQHTLLNERNKLVWILFLGTFFALISGLFIANRSMRSLYLLAETVEKITASSLSKRIDPDDWPIELQGLSYTFNKMLNRLENAFDRLKQFSSDLAHELRTPITNLIGETEMMLSHDHPVSAYQKLMESNLEELHRIASLIENILFLARSENPQIEFKREQIDIHREIKRVLDFYQSLADEKLILMTLNGEASMVANVDMFRRLIGNILSNALKFTPINGHIHFTVSESEGNAYIKLVDNGLGIDAEHLPKLFNRFYQIDAARHQGGAGLGLAIVKSIVELHNGTIFITSEINQGTIIHITFPNLTKL